MEVLLGYMFIFVARVLDVTMATLRMLMVVQIIHKEKSSDQLVNELRDEGFGVTILSGMGREGSRDVISVVIRRKDLPKLKKLVFRFDPNAFIITNSISSISGGYFSTIKKK